jgi:glucose-1-phosphate cytidylyltransferase
MKVVLFCGGLGTRLREHSHTVPKPLVNIGLRPIVWHLMRYYAHYGHKDFILCLGYRGDLIREYFLNYNEALSNDFTLSEGGRRIDLHSSDIDDWRITFVDTGLNTNVGQRLLRVRRFLENEEMFLANYSDGLSDLPLDRQIEDLRRRRGALASLVSVRSSQTFHAVRSGPDGIVGHIGALREQNTFINGGFFVLRPGIFDYLREGDDDLVEHVFTRLIAQRRLAAFPWNGFWQCMDTFKDKMSFDAIEASGECPWMVWRNAGGQAATPARHVESPTAAPGADPSAPAVPRRVRIPILQTG